MRCYTFWGSLWQLVNLDMTESDTITLFDARKRVSFQAKKKEKK